MRKALFIFICLAACLQFHDGRGSYGQYAPNGGVIAAIDPEADQWRCERIYNSDYSVPCDIRVGSPQSVTAPAFRSFGYAGSIRAFFRYMAESNFAATPNLTSEYESSFLSALAYGPDYYVYRLRRLII